MSGQEGTNVGCSAANVSFRSLVVVPRSHSDGTTDELLRRHRSAANTSSSKGGLTEQQKLGTIHVEFSVTSASIGGDNAWSSAIIARAVQLDLRPLEPHTSTYVIWDARTIHQGHEYVPIDIGKGVPDGVFQPPVVRPRTFSNRTEKDRCAWLAFLRDEGYVVLHDVLSAADCLEAGALLQSDIGRVWQPAGGKPVPLAEVRNAMLPQFDNTGIRMGSGLPHGDFAWFVRSRAAVRSVWGELYPSARHGAFLRGTLGSPVLTPPHTEGKPAKRAKKATKGVSGEWLHVDYSPPPASGRKMYQSTLYLRPDLCVEGGCAVGAWGRLGCMVTMAPPLKDKTQDRRVEAILLAAALRGDGSKATAGLAFGLLQPLSPYPPKKPAGSVQRLQPSLRDGVMEDQLVACRIGGSMKTVNVKKLRTMPPTSKTPGNGVADICSIETLRSIVHPRAVALLSNLEGSLSANETKLGSRDATSEPESKQTGESNRKKRQRTRRAE